MAYIKFDITSESVEDGKRTQASITRLRSDRNDKSTYELNIIARALGPATVREIFSCFGAGYWRGDKPWLGKDAWKR